MEKDKTTYCKHIKDEICSNDDCPAVADYCPCTQYFDICKYFEEDTYSYEELLQIDSLT